MFVSDQNKKTEMLKEDLSCRTFKKNSISASLSRNHDPVYPQTVSIFVHVLFLFCITVQKEVFTIISGARRCAIYYYYLNLRDGKHLYSRYLRNLSIHTKTI